MVTKEMEEHAFDISSKYVPRISPDQTEVMDEIQGLPLQDIITIYSNACYALEKGMFAGISNDALHSGEESAVRFNNAIDKVKEIIIERLKESEFWTVTDKITNSPFIDDSNRVWVFTEKTFADECVDYFMQQYRTTFTVTNIPKEDAIKFFGRTAYMKGAEVFIIDMGAYANIQLRNKQIVPPPDFKDVPPIKRPVMNPDFFRAVAKLQEERLYRANYEGKKDKLRQLEDDMIKAFHDAKFLVPVKGMEVLKKNTESTGDNGEGVLKEKTTISIPTLTKGEGDNMVKATPAFTDWEEFNKIYSQNEWGGWIWRSKDLLGAPDDIVCLNAGSFCFEMSKKMISQMMDIYEKEFAN